MRLGAPILDKIKDPQELAQAHVDLGYRAGFCPWGLSMKDPDYLREVRTAFEQRDVVIAEVIGWRNLIPPDDDARAEAFQWMCDQLAVADEIDARCCLSFGGTRENEKGWTPHPDNLSPATFDMVVQTVRRILDEVEPRRTKFALEMMPTVFPNSADNCLELIDAVDRPAFAVHLDPANLIYSPQLYFDNASVIRECFDKLGQWIVSCHAKDIIWRVQRGFHLDESIPGTGNLDYRAYLDGMKRLPPDTPLLLEHMDTQEEYRQGYDYIRSLDTD